MSNISTGQAVRSNYASSLHDLDAEKARCEELSIELLNLVNAKNALVRERDQVRKRALYPPQKSPVSYQKSPAKAPCILVRERDQVRKRALHPPQKGPEKETCRRALYPPQKSPVSYQKSPAKAPCILVRERDQVLCSSALGFRCSALRCSAL